jgi:large subunit ribosomal protein L7A
MIRMEGKSMSLDILKGAKKRTIGTKQTKKALNKGLLIGVFIAMDAERRLIKPVMAAASELGVPVYYVESMKKLGAACEIEVDTAIAGVLKEEK